MNLRLFLVSFALCCTSTSFAIHPDSINHNLEDYQYLIRFTEANLATYPYIPKCMVRNTPSLKSRSSDIC